MDLLIDATIDIDIEADGFIDRVIAGIVSRFNLKIRSSSVQLEAALKEQFKQSIYDSTTVSSLLGQQKGGLDAEFGFIAPESIIGPIIDALVGYLHFQVQDFGYGGGRVEGELQLIAFDSTYNNLLSLPQASYLSHGQPVEWLRWLLFSGATSVVENWFISYDINDIAKSRSGQAIMKNAQGENFYVPEEHRGTANENFITRILDNFRPKVLPIISASLLNG